MRTWNNFLKCWGMPVLLAVASLAGLIAALIGDGIWDLFSWLTLLFPLWIMIWHYYLKKDKK